MSLLSTIARNGHRQHQFRSFRSFRHSCHPLSSCSFSLSHLSRDGNDNNKGDDVGNIGKFRSPQSHKHQQHQHQILGRYHHHPQQRQQRNLTNISALSKLSCISPSYTHEHETPQTATTATTRVAVRSYHSTPPKKILPLIAVGVLGGCAVYTYRALQQLDQDWEEYYDELEEYKRVTGLDPEADNNNSGASGSGSGVAGAGGAGSASAAADAVKSNQNQDLSAFFTGGTLAVDLGTTRLKLSHRGQPKGIQKAGKKEKPDPVVSVDREGFRWIPALAWSSEGSIGGDGGDGSDLLVGRLAATRLYDTKGGSILSARDALLEGNENNASSGSIGNIGAVREIIQHAASDALDQVLGGGGAKNSHPLFVLDQSMVMRGSYNVRPIFTYPPLPSTNLDDLSNPYVEQYQKAVKELTSPDGIAAFVPEPVAAVIGAEYYNLIPSSSTSSSSSSSVLVIDVGGTSTSISIVVDEQVIHSVSLPFGGDTFIDLMVSNLIQDFYGPTTDTKQSTESTQSTQIIDTKHNPIQSLNDPNALQRLYEASTTSLHELTFQSRSQINIPYLTMDMETRKPRHLEVGMARTVVEGMMENWIGERLVPYFMTMESSQRPLSASLPPPNNLAALISSTLMSSLEHTSHTPQMLRAVLLVGGGARIPLVQSSVKKGVEFLGIGVIGNEQKLVIAEGEMGEELTVLGAAVWGSGGR